MQQPKTEEIKNIEHMQNGFTETWKKTIDTTIAPSESWETLKQCPKITIFNNDGNSLIKETTWKDLAKGNLEITGQYT